MNEIISEIPEITITFKKRWFVIFVVSIVVLQQISPERGWMLLSSIFVAIWLFSYIWSKNLAEGLRIERNSKFGWNQVGDVFEEVVFLENRSIFPAMWLYIEDQSTLIGHSISVGTGIGSSTSRRWRKRTVCESRGEYFLGPTQLMTGDIFGMYQVKIIYPQKTSFVVAPPVISLPSEIQISLGQTINDRRSIRKQAEMSNVSVSTREFQPGDSLKRIHWLITARQDVPHVRRHENIHSSNSCWLILDLNQLVHSTNGPNNSVEHSIIVALSLVNMFLLNGLAVGFLASGEHTILVPPAKGPPQFRKIQKVLATIQEGDEPLNNLILRNWRYLSGESDLILVTPSQRVDWLESIQHLNGRSSLATIFLIRTDSHEANDLEKIQARLNRSRIRNYIISHDLFATQDLAPGKKGVISWHFTPLGRAIKVFEEESAEGVKG